MMQTNGPSAPASVSTSADTKASTSTWRTGPTHPATAWMPLATAAVVAAGFACFIVLPYYVNGLHHLPLAEVAGGGHDPKDLWPMASGSAWAGWFQLGGFLTILAGPWFALWACLYGAYAAWRDRAVRSRWVPQALAAVIGLVVVGWLASPMGSSLLAWFMD